MKPDLIDRIYECSVLPDLWPGVLDELAALSDSRGGLLFSARDRVLNWTASANLSEIFRTYVEDGWFPRCTRRVCLFGQSQPGFFVEHDFWTADQLDSNPIYRDFFRPRGLGWSAGTGLQMPTGDRVVFSIEREYSRGPIEKERVDALNELRPHLARSALVTARLGLQRATGAKEALTAMGLPALLLNESGTVIEANHLIEGLGDHVQWRARNRIALADGRASELLWAGLAALDGDPEQAVRSFPLRDADDRAALVVHMIPIRRSAHDIFAGSYVLLVATPVTMPLAPRIELMRSLFDLTPSEARVARGLAFGETLEEIASAGGVAISTVRSQLRVVLQKTGCTRQAELVALLANVTLDRSAPESPATP
ncbi:helix-turn-helix transcriptional regulator [Bradyrhizobium sediminis]|uniref:Helix-turn-helix transcriptional regulator n=1 Tax=Bradyrhizobium sediminis TaxID=2840469 RepID=A0A975RRM7_9BRAD|nr:helix-turn-helix transcriptional regulator [Bradyrhizobium sediminis]QWG17715.1 helix-turn-helix transcriptional regulator [Bradyrhizobium sediminis]